MKYYLVLLVFLTLFFNLSIMAQDSDESLKFKAYKAKGVTSKQWDDCTYRFTITSTHFIIKSDFNVLKCKASIYNVHSGEENGIKYKAATYLGKVSNSRIELMLSLIRYSNGEIRIRQAFVDKNNDIIEYKVKEVW